MAGIDALLRALEQRSAAVGQPRLYDACLLTERAAVSGLKRGGSASCNGTCRLLEASDGWIAINLAREVDRESVPALVGCSFEEEPWSALSRATRHLPADQIVESARRLGLAVAPVRMRPDAPPDEVALERLFPLQRIAGVAPRLRYWMHDPPLVIDLSALWAGPLCAHLLGEAGARVIRVESLSRPDTIRATAPDFFARLNRGKESVALDLTSTTDRARLRKLIARAEIVVSSARARAFEQMDLVRHELVAANPGLTWLAITAYGWSGPARNAIGFGDDAAAGAGLLAWSESGAPMFVGDAIADPLTGIAAAAAAIDCHRGGGGVLIDASLYATAVYVAGGRPLTEQERGRVTSASGSWWLHVAGTRARVSSPRARPLTGSATPFGADTQRVMREFDLG
jgi:hypothetical protein